MVHRDPFAALLVLFEEREIDDPDELEIVLRDQVELSADLEAERAEGGQGDGISVGDDVFVIKTDRVSKLDEMSFSDSDAPLVWNWQARRLISHYDYFVKRASVSVSPITQQLYSGQVRVGAIVVDIPPLRRRIDNERRHFAFSKGERIYKNYALIYGNPQPIYNRPTIVAENRNVYRSKFLDVGGRGASGGVVFNSVTIDLVEV